MKRNTSQRAAIEQVFIRESRPLAVEDVLKIGRTIVQSLNQATVYRNLKLLTQAGWLAKVNHPLIGTLYERTGKDHHHHFHCRICRKVFDVPGCALNDKDALSRGFVTENHEVFLFGICPSCAT